MTARTIRPGKVIKPREREIQKAVMQWLGLHGFGVKKIHTTGIPNGKGGFRTNANAGFSDIIAIREGITYYIEVKTPEAMKKNGLDDDKLAFWDFVSCFGARYFVVTSVDEVENWFYNMGLI